MISLTIPKHTTAICFLMWKKSLIPVSTASDISVSRTAQHGLSQTYKFLDCL